MLNGAQLEVSADVDGDGTAEQATFWLGEEMELTPRIETQDLVGQAGTNALSFVDYVTANDGGHGGINLNFGGGVAATEISFALPAGDPSLDWGDGSNDDAADATGSSVLHQISVWDRYMDLAETDSLAPATLSWGMYSASGVYEPKTVAIQNPTATFDAREQAASFDGSVALVSIRDLENIASASQQQTEK